MSGAASVFPNFDGQMIGSVSSIGMGMLVPHTYGYKVYTFVHNLGSYRSHFFSYIRTVSTATDGHKGVVCSGYFSSFVGSIRTRPYAPAACFVFSKQARYALFNLDYFPYVGSSL